MALKAGEVSVISVGLVCPFWAVSLLLYGVVGAVGAEFTSVVVVNCWVALTAPSVPSSSQKVIRQY